MKNVSLVCSAILLLVVSLSSAHLSPVQALKKRVKAPVAKGVSFSSVKLNRASHSAVVSFFNLSRVRKIEYELSYQTNNRPQGVIGSFTPSGQVTDGRDLYFGTCSKGVCTPHYNITNASLTITTTLSTGAVNRKRYRFKSV